MWSSQRGAVAVFFAVCLAALAGLAALGVDVGRLYIARSRLVAVSEAAALAGAQFLPWNPEAAVATARAYVAKGGLDPAQGRYTVGADGQSLDVTLETLEPLTFARVLGYTSQPVAGRARARRGNVSGVYGAAPLGVVQGEYRYGELVRLKVDSSTCCPAPGNFQALALGGRGAARYEENLAHGYPGWIRLGQWLDTEPGNMAGPTRRAVWDRLCRDPDGTYDRHSRLSPRILRVPVVSSFPNGRGQVRVVGFALFFLEGRCGDPVGSEVLGRFLRAFTEGETTQDAPDYGAYTVKLVPVP